MNYSSIIPIILILLSLSGGCSASKGPKAPNPEMTRCQEDLNTIPEVAAASLKARSKRPDDDEASLEGMEMALTINRMVRTKVDPDQDQDDWCYTENTRENFEKLVSALKQNGIPPTVDFLAGDSLDPSLQEEWMLSGNLIGSMTYTERAIKKGTAGDIISSIARNEAALAPLWGRFEQQRKYFRYPALKLGTDAQKPRQIRAYLKLKGYVEVPATIDPRDDSFSQSYCSALARGDRVCANFIAATFKSSLLDKTIKAHAAARRFGSHDVKQILMIQANQLMCDLLDELLRWYKAMGVRFISVDEALRDPFYATEDITTRGNEVIWETRRAQLSLTADSDRP